MGRADDPDTTRSFDSGALRDAADSLPPGLRLTLSVVEGPDAGQAFEIRRPRVTVGRGEADLRLSDASVSGLHFAVEIKAGEARLEDLGTTNGTLVNGERCDGVVLHTRDEIQAGLTKLQFRVASRSGVGAETVACPEASGGDTRPTAAPSLDPRTEAVLAKLPKGMPAGGTVRDGAHDFQPKVGVMRPDTVVFLEVTSGSDAGATFNLSDPGTYLIGRGGGEIPLADEKCSTKHAQIQILADDQYYLTDLASTNGTFLNEIRTSRRRLKHMDEIRIGATRLRFSCQQGAIPLSD